MSAQEKRLGVKICKSNINGVADVRMYLTDLPDWIEPMDDTIDIQSALFDYRFYSTSFYTSLYNYNSNCGFFCNIGCTLDTKTALKA